MARDKGVSRDPYGRQGVRSAKRKRRKVIREGLKALEELTEILQQREREKKTRGNE